ncbi:MAG: tetratricopeptide repeat protein [Acidobacteria bacterium]|nr:tetratricopeptide repeat protein [Acidobacteriota bacterium]
MFSKTTQHLPALLLLSLTAAGVYGPALDNGFVHDDKYQIVRNPQLHSDQPFYRLFTTDVWGYTTAGQESVSNYYRPLQMLTYRLTALWGGLSPRVFHGVNLLFHVLGTLMAYVVFRKLTGKFGLALSAALLFALHPIHTEAVIWIAALTELGCAFFYFLAFYLFLQVYPSPQPVLGKSKKSKGSSENKEHLFWYQVGALAAFGAALLWKEMAVTFPLIVGGYAFLFSGNSLPFGKKLQKAVWYSLPFLGVLSIYLVMRFVALGYLSKVQHTWEMSKAELFLSMVSLLGKYWLHLFVPSQLNAFHLFEPVRSLRDPSFLLALSGIAALLVLAIRYRFSRPPVSLAIGWVFLTLLPVLNIQGLGLNVFAERYLYIPSLGFCLLVVLWAEMLLVRLPERSRSRTAAVLMIPVVTFYGFQVLRRIPDWKEDHVFFSRAVEASPRSASMRNSLAHVLREERKDLDGAERESLRALEIAETASRPDKRQIAMACLNLSNISIQRQHYPKALELAEKGLATDNQLPMLHVARGVALVSLGRLEEARRVLLEAQQRQPNDEIVLHFLGIIALNLRQTEMAVQYLEKALEVLPSYVDAHNNLGAAYTAQGRYAEALPHFEQAAALDPRNSTVYSNLGIVLARLGRTVEARAKLQQALLLSPNDSTARAELAALEQLRPPDRAAQ